MQMAIVTGTPLSFPPRPFAVKHSLRRTGVVDSWLPKDYPQLYLLSPLLRLPLRRLRFRPRPVLLRSSLPSALMPVVVFDSAHPQSVRRLFAKCSGPAALQQVISRLHLRVIDGRLHSKGHRRAICASPLDRILEVYSGFQSRCHKQGGRLHFDRCSDPRSLITEAVSRIAHVEVRRSAMQVRD